MSKLTTFNPVFQLPHSALVVALYFNKDIFFRLPSRRICPSSGSTDTGSSSCGVSPQSHLHEVQSWSSSSPAPPCCTPACPAQQTALRSLWTRPSCFSVRRGLLGSGSSAPLRCIRASKDRCCRFPQGPEGGFAQDQMSRCPQERQPLLSRIGGGGSVLA